MLHGLVEVPDRVVTRAIDESTVLLNTDTGRYFTLDNIGTTVWSLLTPAAAVQDIYDALLLRYQVEPEDLKQDLESLLARLEAEGLVEIRRD